VLLITVTLSSRVRAQPAAPSLGDSTKVDFANFQNPPLEFRGTRWFTFQLGNITEESAVNMVQQARRGDPASPGLAGEDESRL
jgi:hypothetical protein